MGNIHVISKLLSANDTGDTGAHQAGILVPKDENILGFFPSLDSSVKNPRMHLQFEDEHGDKWEFAFIYYNNARFGGTRNEYRLTRMTPYIKRNALKPGDEIFFEKHSEGKRYLRYKRVSQNGKHVLKLSGKWKVIKI